MVRMIAGFLAVAALMATGAQAAQPKVGEPAPPFTMTMMDGSKVSSADLKGQVVVLNFWATWCGPCREELPLLNAYYAMQKKFGLSVFAVEDQDEASVPLSKLKPFLAKLTMPSARRISGPYGQVHAFPTNYIIDRKGVIRYAKAAAFDLDALNSLLVPLLQEPVPE